MRGTGPTGPINRALRPLTLKNISNMPNHSTRRSILAAADDLVRSLAGKKDHFPHAEIAAIQGALYDAWDSQLQLAVHELKRIVSRITAPTPDEKDEILAVFGKHLSGGNITVHLQLREHVKGAFEKAKKQAVRNYTSLGGKLPKKKADQNFGFGIIYGITETHAVAALEKFLTLSAGGFWDEEMTQVITRELDAFFKGGLTRLELTDNLERIVNERLAIDGKTSLPRSYFDGISQHFIVESRDAGNTFKGVELGAIGYRLINPNPKTDICKELTKSGEIFPFANAVKQLQEILSAKSLADLKTRAPFSSTKMTRSTPPFHWRCKTEKTLVFKGLND